MCNEYFLTLPQARQNRTSQTCPQLWLRMLNHWTGKQRTGWAWTCGRKWTRLTLGGNLMSLFPAAKLALKFSFKLWNWVKTDAATCGSTIGGPRTSQYLAVSGCIQKTCKHNCSLTLRVHRGFSTHCRPIESNFSWSSGESLNNVGTVEVYKQGKHAS